MDSFAWALAGLWIFGASLQVLGTLKLISRRSRGLLGSSQNPGMAAIPPLSILKPLKGSDEGLEENLRSFFQLTYPKLELLFCMESPRDPAFAVVQKVAREFPRVSHRLFFSSAAHPHFNPKVANIEGAYRSAQHDLVLISDSNVRIDDAALFSLVEESQGENVGIVTGIVRGDLATTFAGELEAVYLNTFYARGMVLADAVDKTAVVGKAMLFRRSVLARLGGLRVLGLYLAEDYMAGVGLRHLGYEIRLANARVSQVIGNYRFMEFWKRHIRWGRIRKSQAPVIFVLEPIAQTFFLVVIGTFLFRKLGLSLGAAFTVQIGLFFVIDAITQLSLGARIRAQTVAAWCVRECLAPVLWIVTCSGNTVDWRGKRLSVRSGGILQTEPQEVL